MILTQNDRFQHKKMQTQNFKMSKIDMNHLQDLKNLKNPIFNGSRTNFAQNRILKKKKALPNTENPRFFEIHKSIKWPGLAGIGR
jgi:hypothetical protein